MIKENSEFGFTVVFKTEASLFFMNATCHMLTRTYFLACLLAYTTLFSSRRENQGTNLFQLMTVKSLHTR